MRNPTVDLPALHFLVRLTENDWVRIRLLLLSLKFPAPRRWAVGLLLKAVAVGCIFAMLEYDAPKVLIWGFLFAMCASLQLLFLPLTTQGRARAEFRKREHEFGEFPVSLSGSGISLEAAEGRVDVLWDSVPVVVDTPRGVLFCRPDHSLLCYLPARVLDDVTRSEIQQLLQAAGIDVRRSS